MKRLFCAIIAGKDRVSRQLPPDSIFGSSGFVLIEWRNVIDLPLSLAARCRAPATSPANAFAWTTLVAERFE